MSNADRFADLSFEGVDPKSAARAALDAAEQPHQ